MSETYNLCKTVLHKMSKTILQMTIFCFFWTGCTTCQALEKQYGISFTGYANWAYANPEADQSLENLAATGIEWTNILVPQLMDNINSTIIYSSRKDGTPSDPSLIHAIQKAHSLGLKVMLNPHLELANDPSHWFGELGLNFSKQQWIEWFDAYTKFLSHYADIAQANGVEQMSIGMELLYAEKQETHWRKLIRNLRQHFKGTLVYAENYNIGNGKTFTSGVSWWDELDYIGIDTYYDLAPEGNNNPTFEDMKQTWKPIVKRLGEYSKKWNKPILIHELGYRIKKNSIQHHWEAKINESAVDLEEQANAHEAFYHSFVNKPWFGGIFWSIYTTKSNQGRLNNLDYTPLNKLAEDVIRINLNKPAPEPENNGKEINNSGISVDGNSKDWPASVAVNDENSGTSPVDFLKAWSKQDKEYIYIAYKNRTAIDIASFWAWLTLIDADKDLKTGANIYDEMGADFLVLGSQLYRYEGDGSSWKWSYIRDVEHAVKGHFAELAISKSNLSGSGEAYLMLWGSNFYVDGSLDDNVKLFK